MLAESVERDPNAVRVFDPRADPEPPEWREFVVRQQLHPVWDYQLMRLESWMARNPPVLVIAGDPSRPVAAMSAMVCRPWPDSRYAPIHTRRFRPRWAEVSLPWLSGFPALAFEAGLDLSERRRWLRAMERELARYLGFGLLGVVYRPVPSDLVPVVAGGLRPVQRIDTVAVLENRWSTVQEWLATLDKERRRSLRRRARGFDQDRTLVVRFDAGRDDLDPHEAAALLDRHRRRLGIPTFDRRTRVSGAYLDALVRRPDVYTLTYHADDGRLLAFHTLIDHPRSAIMQYWASLPVAEGGRNHLYFDCYLRGIRHVIDHGRAELSAGRGMQDLKGKFGFTRRALVSVAVPRPLIGR